MPVFVFAEGIKKLSEPVYPLSEKTFLNSSNDQDDKNDSGWLNTGSKNGIRNFQKNIPGTSTKAYKGICVINSPMKKIYAILSDVASHSSWVKFCKYSRVVSTNSPASKTLYYNFDIPWPLSNRDVVINTTTDIDLNAGKITIKSIAAKDSLIPLKKGYIRLTDSNQTWGLEKITPKSTRVTFISCTPLKSSVPGFLKQIVSNLIPCSTLHNLNRIANPSHSKYLVKNIFLSKEKKP